jgi:hypothetical protein
MNPIFSLKKHNLSLLAIVLLGATTAQASKKGHMSEMTSSSSSSCSSSASSSNFSSSSSSLLHQGFEGQASSSSSSNQPAAIPVDVVAADGSKKVFDANLFLCSGLAEDYRKNTKELIDFVQSIQELLIYKNTVKTESDLNTLHYLLAQCSQYDKFPSQIAHELALPLRFKDIQIAHQWLEFANHLDIQPLRFAIAERLVLKKDYIQRVCSKDPKDSLSSNDKDFNAFIQRIHDYGCQQNNSMHEKYFIQDFWPSNIGICKSEPIADQLWVRFYPQEGTEVCKDPRFLPANLVPLIHSLPTCATKAELIEQYIAKNFADPRFNFMEWYQKLPPGYRSTSPRFRVVAHLKQQAADFFIKNTDQDDAKTFFDALPSGAYKMYIAHEYFKTHKQHIDQTDQNPGMAIEKIMQVIKANENYISLSDYNLTTLDGIVDLIVIQNEIAPITALSLSWNQLTQVTIPATLTNLQYLYLNNNQLTQITIPASLINLKNLYLNNNQLTQITIPASLINLKDLFLYNNPSALRANPDVQQQIDALQREIGARGGNLYVNW